MPHFFTYIDLIAFHRSSKCKNVLWNNLILGHIVNVILKFRKSQPRYSYKVYSYKKTNKQTNKCNEADDFSSVSLRQSEIWPLSTCLLPNCSVWLPHLRDTTESVAVETELPKKTDACLNILMRLRITSIRSDVSLLSLVSLLFKCSLLLTLEDIQPSCIWIDDIIFPWVNNHHQGNQKIQAWTRVELSSRFDFHVSQTEEVSFRFKDKEKDKFSASAEGCGAFVRGSGWGVQMSVVS